MPARPAARGAAPRPGGVRSLADIAKSDEDSDEDERNEYYAGGEKSGQVWPAAAPAAARRTPYEWPLQRCACIVKHVGRFREVSCQLEGQCTVSPMHSDLSRPLRWCTARS